MNSLRCSNCAFLNFATATACKRCGLPFDSPAGGDWNPQPYAPDETYLQPSDGGSFFWDQPQAPPRPNYYLSPPAPTRSSLAIVFKILIAVAVVFVVSALAIPKLLKRKGADYTNLSWYEHQAPDKRFSVSLPGTPKIIKRTVPSPFGNAEAQVFEAAVGNEGGCMVMVADYPAVNPNISEDTIYDMAIQGATRTKRTLGLGARKYITLDGYRGVEVELHSNDPKYTIIGSVRIFWVSPRMYVVATGGPDTEEFRAVHNRCLDSFKISGSK